MLPRIPMDLSVVRLAPGEVGWDPGLDGLKTRVAELFVVGVLPPGPRVSIVGTRRADPEALRFTARLVRDLGLAVVSGGALGVDAAAHQAALEVGLPTVAVLANGVERAYPTCHADLFAEVASSGALVSEYRDVPPHRGRFLRRNRIIAALAEVVVVVQAPRRSGALNTARHARALGRTVLALPAAPWDLRGAGNLDLLAGGAVLCRDADDVRRVLGLAVPSKPKARGARATSAGPAPASEPTLASGARDHGQELSPPLRRVLEQLSSTPRTCDALCAAVGMPVREVQSALLELVVLGWIEAREGAYVRRR